VSSRIRVLDHGRLVSERARVVTPAPSSLGRPCTNAPQRHRSLPLLPAPRGPRGACPNSHIYYQATRKFNLNDHRGIHHRCNRASRTHSRWSTAVALPGRPHRPPHYILAHSDSVLGDVGDQEGRGFETCCPDGPTRRLDLSGPRRRRRSEAGCVDIGENLTQWPDTFGIGSRMQARGTVTHTRRRRSSAAGEGLSMPIRASAPEQCEAGGTGRE
jgi:hypothetical protein